MAKRFTDSEKWRDPWFCALSTPEKMFWLYLLDNCNMAGIWQVNWPLVRFYVPELSFKPEVFEGRIEKLSDEKWWIKKFTDFQYGELQSTNRMHQRITYELQKEGVSTPLKYPLQGVKDKEEDKDRVKDKVKVLRVRGVGEGKQDFERFWAVYPKKVSKGSAEKAWLKLSPSSEQVNAMIAAVSRAKTSKDWTKDEGQFIPHPATWINGKRWEDVIDGQQNTHENGSTSAGSASPSKFAGLTEAVEV